MSDFSHFSLNQFDSFSSIRLYTEILYTENCPLDNKCLTPNIIYEAQITNNTNGEHKKERYNNHTQDFKDKKYMKCIELSKYIWSLKNQRIRPIVKWSIV